jgi:hypothetical protein
MPIIKYDGSFSYLEKAILSKTAKANLEYLGIANADFRVQIKAEKFSRPTSYAVMMQNKTDKSLFHVAINRNGFNFFDATSSQGHELVHVKQHLENRLVDDYDREGIHWNGEFWPGLITKLAGNDVPWEEEAWAIQGALHKHAVESLPLHLRGLIDRTQSHGLNRLW